MLFENFYQTDSEYDRIVRQWWIFILLIIAVFIGFLFIPDSEPSPRPPTVAERIQHIDELCRSLPKPEDFELIYKSSPFNLSYSVSVDFEFYSKRSQEEILPIFVFWFTENGWTDKESNPNKDNYAKQLPQLYLSNSKPRPNNDKYAKILARPRLSYSKGIQTISIENDLQPNGSIYRITCTEQKLNKL